MRNKVQSSSSLLMMSFLFFCLAFLIMAKKDITKTERTGEGKDYSHWSINDLRNELKRFGEDVSESVQRTDLIQRLNKYYHDKKDSIHNKKESLKEKFYPHDEHGDVKDFADWSINDLKNELKRYGEKITDGIGRTEMVKRLNKYYHDKKDSIHDKKESLKEKFYPHDEHGDVKDFTDWSISDLKNELKRYGENVVDGIGRTEMVKRLNKYYHDKKDSIHDKKESLKEKLHLKPDSFDFSGWSIIDLRNELKRNGEILDEGVGRSELIKRLKKYYHAKKETFENKFHSKHDDDYFGWTVIELEDELRKYGEKVAEGVKRSELVQRLKKYHHAKDSHKEKEHHEHHEEDKHTIDHKETPHIEHHEEDKHIIDHKETPHIEHEEDDDESTYFVGWSIDDLSNELKRLGEHVEHWLPRSDLVRRLKKHYVNQKDWYDEKFHPDSGYVKPQQDKKYRNWSIQDLEDELRKHGEHVEEGLQRSELVIRLEKYHVDPSYTMKSNPETGYVKTMGEKDYNRWSSSDLRYELRKYGEDIAEGIEKPDLIARLRKYHSNPSIKHESYPESGHIKTDEELDYYRWSDKQLRKELKKYGEDFAEGLERHDLIEKLSKHLAVPSINHRPESIDRKPESFDHKPESFNYKHETINLRPESIDRKPESVNYKHETINHRPESFDHKPESVLLKNQDYINWSADELRNELNRFGEHVPDEIERIELVKRLRVHYKDTVVN